MEINNLIDICKNKNYKADVVMDGMMLTGFNINSIYRVTITNDNNEAFVGIGSGDPEASLFNAYAKALNLLGHSIEFKTVTINNFHDDYVVTVGKYRGKRLNEIPFEFIEYWSNQLKTGNDLDLLIQKCKEWVVNNPASSIEVDVLEYDPLEMI